MRLAEVWKRLCAAGSLFLAASSSVSASSWDLSETTRSKWAAQELRQDKAPDGLPDGHIAKASKGDIGATWYSSPTTRYRHGVIGDAIEAGRLNVKDSAGTVHFLDLPESEVFEDRTPRLADLDGDGRTEVITIRSSSRGGGSVTLYGVRYGTLREIASTGFIGRANRWLNIAGIADYLGTGSLQIAYVETPHIGGTLRVFEFTGGPLREVLSARGFSNHAIGSRNLGLSATADMNGDGIADLLVPTNSRRELKALSLNSGTVREIASIKLPAELATDIHVERSAGGTAFLFGLDNGRFYRLK
ncbi:hypothetical protein [Roseibium sediminis]|uniref:hypothetical protein n=1 Tax=Roseibium sediminis TaxID=1775174 RepID=UPI00123D1299|nr:hypothetical protein [Roseibium sediminis]